MSKRESADNNKIPGAQKYDWLFPSGYYYKK